MTSHTRMITKPIVRILIPRSFHRRLFFVTVSHSSSFRLDVGKLIPDPSDRQDESGTRWISLNLVPELSNVDIYDSVNHHCFTPWIEISHELIAREDLPWSGHEGLKEFILVRRNHDWTSAHAHLTFFLIQDEISMSQNVLLFG